MAGMQQKWSDKFNQTQNRTLIKARKLFQRTLAKQQMQMTTFSKEDSKSLKRSGSCVN